MAFDLDRARRLSQDFRRGVYGDDNMLAWVRDAFLDCVAEVDRLSALDRAERENAALLKEADRLRQDLRRAQDKIDGLTTARLKWMTLAAEAQAAAATADRRIPALMPDVRLIDTGGRPLGVGPDWMLLPWRGERGSRSVVWQLLLNGEPTSEPLIAARVWEPDADGAVRYVIYGPDGQHLFDYRFNTMTMDEVCRTVAALLEGAE